MDARNTQDSVDSQQKTAPFEFKSTLTLTIDNQEINAKHISSHSRTIYDYDLGNGYWIMLMQGEYTKDDGRVQAECDYYNKLIQCGLRAPSFQKKIVYLEGREDPVSALMIPSFDSLLQQGKQIRCYDIADFSRGKSLIFGSKDNINDLAHWRAIFKGIKQDIVIHLLNNFSFRLNAFNIIIEDTVNTPQPLPDEKARVFSEMHQEIHLYFADFYRMIHDYEGRYCHFIDRDGAILEDEIVNRISKMRTHITDAIIQVISSDEEIMMTGTWSLMGLYNLMQASTALEQAWNEVVVYVLAEITERVAKMTDAERAKYTVPAPDPEIVKKNREWLDRKIAKALAEAKQKKTEQVAVYETNSPSVTRNHTLFSERQAQHQRKKQALDAANIKQSNQNDCSGCTMM